MEQKSWFGACDVVVEPGALGKNFGRRKIVGGVSTPGLWRVYIGLAGFIGEQMASADARVVGFDAVFLLSAFNDAVDAGEVSQTDLQAIYSHGKAPTLANVSATTNFLSRYWKEVEFEACGL